MFAADDIYHATITTLKILENFQCTRQKNAQSKSEFSDLSSAVSNSLSGESSESAFISHHDIEKNVSGLCPNSNIEFQSTIEGLEVMNLMYNFYHEKKSEQKENEMQVLMDICADVMVASNVKAKIQKLNSVLNHISAISKAGTKLRQVLRSDVLNQFLKINVNYHKSVVRFFTLAQEITKDIQRFITSIEKCKEHNPERSKNLYILETKLLVELHENLDILTEFRNYVQTVSSLNVDVTRMDSISGCNK